MPIYLVDEGGEKTHALVSVEEYERLARSAEKLGQMREYATQMMAAVGKDADTGGAGHESPHDSHGEDAHNGHEHHEHQEGPREQQGGWHGR